MRRPRGICPRCDQDVPLRKDGTPCDHTIGSGPYALGESREYCDARSAKEHRTAQWIESLKTSAMT